LDEETGLYYYGARYYDARISVWLSADPLQEKYPNVSTYVYCVQNPVKFIDPNGREWGIVVNANGTMTVTLNVGFSVSSNLNLSAAQIDTYKASISAQLNSTFMEASGGKISATINFDGGKALNRFTPNIRLEEGGGMAAGMFIPGQETVSLYINNAKNIAEFGETGVHELLHTLNLGDVADSPNIGDTKMTKIGNEYFTTSTTAKDIHKNVMNYGQTKIDGKSFQQMYNSYSGMNQLTPGQINYIINAIYKQMQGYGMKFTNDPHKHEVYYERYWFPEVYE
jgi:RHS repeat-associated protein